MKQKSLEKLVDRYLEGTASEAESKIVEAFLAQLELDSVVRLSADEEDAKEALLLQRIQSGMQERRGLVISISRVWKVGIAAAILVIAVSAWFIIANQPKKIQSGKVIAVTDVQAPESGRAVITLADGSKVYLDSAGSGQLAIEGNIKLVKLSDGQIAYQSASGEIIKELKYNTLSNPRGSKVIDMKLSDGSHVWLNSGSSITYPVAFVGRDRRITVDGEAYFEVAHDPAKPFIVNKGETSVQVLGTHFNVNAYSDEGDIKVTLLEGSVKVTNKSNQLKIKPGEQARVGSDIRVLRDIDVDEVMAWKNGIFILDNTDLPTIMRQISRWYDVSVIYEGAVPARKFGGGVSKNLPLSKVIELLRSNGIEAELQGKTLKVK